MSTPPPTHGLRGELRAPYGNLIHGWAWSTTAPKRRWWVEILLEDLALAVVEARLHYPGLAAAGIGDGCHGFCFALPESLLGDRGRISARIANTDRSLPGTYHLGGPIDPAKAPLPSSLPLDGELVVSDGGLHIHGWVNDPSREDQPVTIVFYQEREELCRTVTDADQRFAAALPLTLADGKEHQVKVLANDRQMPGSPVSVFSHRRGVQHLFHGIIDRIGSGIPLSNLTAEITVMDRLLHESELRLPQGLSFADYPAWFDAFESQEQPLTTPGTPFLVLIRHGQELGRTLNSLVNQTHAHWRARVIGAPAGVTLSDDPRISAETTEFACIDADAPAEDTLVTFVEAGDHLPPHALAWVAQSFSAGGIDALYTDCDHDGPNGERTAPWLKPSWDFELFQSVDYTHHLFVVRAACLNGAKLNRLTDLPFIAAEALLTRSPPSRPWHLPRVLYHRRHTATFGPKMSERRRQRVQSLLETIYTNRTLEVLPHQSGDPSLRYVRWPADNSPKVSILIPTRDRLDLLRACVESLLSHTDYPDFEVLILDNDSRETETLDWLKQLSQEPRCRVIPCPGAFNYSRINNLGVAASEGELLCLLNNDTLVPETSAHWLKEMVSRLQQPDVGAVGAKLIWQNHMVQHAGVVLGVGGIAGHIGNTWMDRDSGYRHLNQLPHASSAVTAACLLTPKPLYLELGGLDANAYPVAFNDVDYCLRVQEVGQRVLWTPFATLYHLESQSRGLDHAIPEKQARARREIAMLHRRWGARIAADPYYHPSLSLYARQSPFEGLALPPRDRKPR
ncbi:glycosyltransferase [Thiorhodococcus mannitoliphagus]|uniref:Glycosyltransferase n=1 Tax=Thiorhodococcus mannitoliphagus TaxID=329406 RepID=A0A6P1DQH4_9GAMM|nr:glycosyltransferase family 2 protein [Thiorhodococcus mannitoliphagus]NEX19403.1 glycosyltransferase [Thiorhodococcus mannitoliphagus]